MITLGLDPHPSTHTVVALDENGASLGHLTVPNTPEGLIRLHEFGARFFPCRWAVEGAGNHFIAAFVAELVAGSESVFSIPPSLTSQYRARPGRKKSDVIDAENVVRALLANPQRSKPECPPTAQVDSAPAVISDLPDLRAVAEEVGLMVDYALPGDTKSLAAALVRLLCDP